MVHKTDHYTYFLTQIFRVHLVSLSVLESVFPNFFQWAMVFKNQDTGARCAHCSCVAIVCRPSEQIELGNMSVCAEGGWGRGGGRERRRKGGRRGRGREEKEMEIEI